MTHFLTLKTEFSNLFCFCDWSGRRYCVGNRTPYSNWFRKTLSCLMVTLVDQ